MCSLALVIGAETLRANAACVTASPKRALGDFDGYRNAADSTAFGARLCGGKGNAPLYLRLPDSQGALFVLAVIAPGPASPIGLLKTETKKNGYLIFQIATLHS
jgi:hypothetical protein